MLKTLLHAVVVFGLLGPAFVAAEEPVITVRKGDRVSLTVSPLGGSSGAAVTQVLQKDLDLAGWFDVVDAARASYTVSGSAGGGSLHGKVTDGGGGVVLSKPTAAVTARRHTSSPTTLLRP